MYVRGQCVRAMEAGSRHLEWVARENEQRSEEDERGRESGELKGGGGKDAFFYGGIALTAAWQRRPRQCLLGF